MSNQRFSYPRRLSALALAACAIAPAVSTAQEVTVVSIQGMTGPVAFAGGPFQNGIRMAFEEAAAKGTLGSLKVKLVEADNAGDKGQAINLANQAIDRDKAILVIGPSASNDGVAIAPIFHDKKVPLLAMATADALIAPGPYNFKVQQSGADVAPTVAKYALDKLKVRKLVVITDRSNPGLVDYKKFFTDAFVAGGGTLVAEETLVNTDSNFLPLATKLKGMDFDALYLAVLAEQGGNLMTQLRQTGLSDKVKVIGSLGVASAKYLEVGGKAAEGTISATEYLPGVDRPLNKQFEAAYQAKYKVAPDSWPATGYTAGLIAIAALKAAGPNPDREKVREALSKLKDVPIVAGSGTWNHTDRRPRYGSIITVSTGGKYVAAPQ